MITKSGVGDEKRVLGILLLPLFFFQFREKWGGKQEKGEKEETGVSRCGSQRVESRSLTYLIYVLRSALRWVENT